MIKFQVEEQTKCLPAKSGNKKGRRGGDEFKTAGIYKKFIKKFGKGAWATWHKKRWKGNLDAQKRAFRKVCIDVRDGNVGSDPSDASASESGSEE